MDNWKSIHTVKDRTKAFLVYCPEYSNTYVVTKRDGEFHHFGGAGRLLELPSHWCELPDNPTPETVKIIGHIQSLADALGYSLVKKEPD